MKAAIATFVLLIPLAGCQGDFALPDFSSKPASSKKITVMQPTPGVRFTPTSDGNLAFDGQTGQLCRARPYQQDEEQRETLCVLVLSNYPTKP